MWLFYIGKHLEIWGLRGWDDSEYFTVAIKHKFWNSSPLNLLLLLDSKVRSNCIINRT